MTIDDLYRADLQALADQIKRSGAAVADAIASEMTRLGKVSLDPQEFDEFFAGVKIALNQQPPKMEQNVENVTPST